MEQRYHGRDPSEAARAEPAQSTTRNVPINAVSDHTHPFTGSQYVLWATRTPQVSKDVTQYAVITLKSDTHP